MGRLKHNEPSASSYFARLAQAAFSNPFGDTFQALQSTVAECPARVHQLAQHGRAHLAQYPRPAEHETMRIVFLFEAYLRTRDHLDELVSAQLARKTSNIPVPFAQETLALLARRGFSATEAARAFALFFQTRRAHHFIAQGLVGGSACMREFRRHLWDNVFTHDIRHYEQGLWNRMEDFSTLLLGETGTGKGTAAAALGRSGFIPFDTRQGCFTESFMRGFVSLNLSQFAEALLESELFGHRKGAFTGAVEAHPGVLSRGSPHGAIFLDEIGEVPPPVQIKLLRVLQERYFTPVGSHEQVRFCGRVIAATNRTQAELRGPGGFRDDFYYRLCSDVITVPPLRQRLQEDATELPALLHHILDRVAGPTAPSLLPMVSAALQPLLHARYPWPGNVRELEQAVRRILLTRHYAGEHAGDATAPEAALLQALHQGTATAEQLLGTYCTLLYARWQNVEEVARRTNLDRRTVKRYLALEAPH